MLEIAIMLEGQNGLTWPRWQKIAAAVEDLGFAGLYRSDHFTNMDPPDKDSLELWTSLTWLASHTKRIEFGPLVSPVSFRHPALTARMAAAVDDLSGGRLTLGLGAGWQEREHHLFGFDLLDTKARFARFEEGLEVITRLLESDQPVTFEGKYYQLRGATLLPRPARPGGPRILIGGNGEKRTLPLVAKYADEWNAVFLPAKELTRLNANLDELLKAQGRKPESVRRSMMTGLRFGRTKKELDEKLVAGKHTAEELRKRGLVVGAGDEVKEQLGELEKAGLRRVMLQWMDLDDLEDLARLAKAVL
jgi:F420-dependent oxidoreductase-like protein